MSKKRRERAQEKQAKQAQQRNLMYGAALVIGLAIIGGLYWINANGGLGGSTFRDIHGMSYTLEGELVDDLLRRDQVHLVGVFFGRLLRSETA